MATDRSQRSDGGDDTVDERTDASAPATVNVTERGVTWAMGHRDGKVLLVWSHPFGEGTVNGSVQWDSVDDVPVGFDPAAHVDEAAADRGGAVGQTSQVRRWVLLGGWCLYVHRYGGPPTWKFPRVGVKVNRQRLEVRAGWLQTAFAVALRVPAEKGGRG